MKEDEHVVPKNKEQELLARLQAQFGDLDVGDFLGGDDGAAGKDDESESSLEEPTAEELLAWQHSQYEIGNMKLEAKRIIEGGGGSNNKHKSALQRRRQNKTAEERRLMREYEATEANEWEHLTTSPDLGGVTSTFFPTVLGDGLELMGGVNPQLQKLASGDEVLGTKWSRLYSSSDGDGLSFRNLLDKICGYEGPTVLLIGGTPSPSKCVGQIPTQDDRVSLGFYTQDTWTVSKENFGGSDDDCFLFSLDHNKTNGVQFFRPKARGGSNRYLYCHPSSLATASKKRKYVPNGIRIGGDRLHITESLEECRALAYDDVFEEGDLLCGKCIQSLFYFDIDCIEVWGVGGDEWIADALKAQPTSKSIQSANLERARKVNKSHFLDDFQNGLLSGAKSGLFGHRDLVEERCDL